MAQLIHMSQKEINKFEVITSVIGGTINGTDAAKQLNLSTRHIRRLKSKVLKDKAKGLIHGNRGRSSNRKLDPHLIKKAKGLLKEKYYDFGPTFASEKLDENHDIQINKETVRQIMVDMGFWQIKPRKQTNNRHTWRARKDNLGELQQFDGSYHIWFGDEENCLLLSVDDATGRITHAVFDINESTMAVFRFWLDYFEKNSLPIAIYLDKFSTYKINHKNQVGVRPITAHSPEAKGRVERMFRTLQDRLVKEMRLAGIKTIEDANKFLETYIPKFNEQFAVIPQRRKDLHKTLSKTTREKLPQIFSIQESRVVCNDYTIRFKNKYYQLNDSQPCTVYKKDTVTIEEHLDNAIKINCKSKYLNYTELPERPQKEIDIKLVALTHRKPSQWKPPADHPWRRQYLFSKKLKIEQQRI